ncbi:MAG: sigma-70 family RNA polymerase sigma factor [Chloroflexi bacterium]|nr:MAG: sigma-70 family RNA polymerase sigma factor [Chloroflexota bacterium]
MNASDRDWLAAEFERARPRLRAVAYRMLGSLSEADDAVQECWLRLERSDSGPINDLRGWLVTVVGRISLDALRARRAAHEEYRGTWMPEPVIATEGTPNPEDEALLADSVGLALLVVLETLTPPERLAFVLHDIFDVPFEDIAPVVGRTTEAARQLASRARRRVRRSAPEPDADLALQRSVVDAFLAASRAGDFAGLLAVLDPSVVLRSDGGGTGPLARPPIVGAEAVARRLQTTGPRFAAYAQWIVVNGGAGVIVRTPNQPPVVVAFTVSHRLIAAIDLIADPAKLTELSGRSPSERGVSTG